MHHGFLARIQPMPVETSITVFPDCPDYHVMSNQHHRHQHRDSTRYFAQITRENAPAAQSSSLQATASASPFQGPPMEMPIAPPTLQFRDQDPHMRDTFREGDEELEVEGLTASLEVLNPSPEGFSSIMFPNIPHQTHSALPSHPPPPTPPLSQISNPAHTEGTTPSIPT